MSGSSSFGVQRRLAAILAADVAGFSALMEKNEEGTLAQVKALQQDVIAPAVQQHKGRLVKTTGDGFLIEFPSPVEAVRCALAVQKALAAGPLQLRIGINLGDVIVEPDGDIYGDGVNVAARLEALCAPGGVLVSGKVYDEADGKVDVAFQSRGDQQVKNIARPVRVYAYREPRAFDAQPKPLPIPDKPSIAVLPFTNMSGESEQEYFADGITEDIITALAKWRWLFVIARNSTFTYKGRAVNVRQVASELGVHYVLEGSVRKAGSKVRINGQLIEAATGSHLWAERYDSDLTDIFTLQDEITKRVVVALDPAIRASELQRSARKPSSSLDAYDHFLRGSAHYFTYKKSEMREAIRHLREAIALDQNFALAYARLAEAHAQEVWMGWSDDLDRSVDEGYRAAERAIALDDLESSGHVALSYHLLRMRRHDRAIASAQRAIELNSNFAEAHFALGLARTFGGRSSAAIESYEAALRHNPYDPYAWAMYGCLSLAHYCAGQYEEALSAAMRALSLRERYFVGKLVQTAALARLGQLREATAAGRSLAGLSVAKLARDLPFREETDLDSLLEGARQAGMPA